MQCEHNGYLITDDPARLDPDAICRLLNGSYWAAQRSRDVIQRSLRNSICFGLYLGSAQVGFARVVTDSATFSWICDVIIDPAHRSAGLGKWLVECVLAHPVIATTVKMLRTRDAHILYEQFGFTRSECMLLRPPAHIDWQPAS
jgi:GNAT superfamily N-acetyltransferase